MNTTNYYKSKTLSKVINACCAIFIILSLSCSKDNDGGRGGSFKLQDNPSTLEVPEEGSSKTFTFTANGNWKVEPLHKERWLKIDPIEGNGDGTFTVTVSKNTTQETRNTTLFFTVGGQLQNEVLKIAQSASVGGGETGDSFMYIEELQESLEVPVEGVTMSGILRATGNWQIELSKEDADWVTIEPMEGTGDAPVKLTVNKNLDVERNVNLLFFLDDEQQPNPLAINQEGVIPQVSGDVILEEDFSWLKYDNGNTILHTSSEKRMDSWTPEETARGWTSTANPVEGSGKTVLLYARYGFVKLGKTTYSGDLISPKLEDVQNQKNLVVTFKAVPYMSKGGTKDANLLKVNVIGPGTISQTEFTIDNWPDYQLDPECTEVWKEAKAIRSFTITGATAETQIRFLGDAFLPAKTNRIFIDDIVIKVQ